MFVFFRLLIIAVTFLVINHFSLNRPVARFTPPPTVSVEGGVLEGIYFGETQKGVAFLGIPYAAPPVGPLRWKPPQPVNAWTGARRATEFGAACPQVPAPGSRKFHGTKTVSTSMYGPRSSLQMQKALSFSIFTVVQTPPAIAK